jgi:hypothetical protein
MPAELNHGLYVFFLALEDRFHASVGAVADPAFHVEVLGSALGFLPEENALNFTVYEHVSSSFHVSAL